MTPKAKKYLGDMLEKARALVDLPAQRSLDDLEQDRWLCAGVERELMIIGEALYLLSQDSPDIAAQVPHAQEIIAMRHRLVHGYSTVLPPILIEVVENDLPPLIERLEAMLAE